MRRVASTIVHSLKDQLRGVRYSVRAEAEAPGSVIPLIHQAMDLGPFAAIETAIRTPALRVADGLFTQVETAATDLLDRVDPRAVGSFPIPLSAYRRPGMSRGVDFSETVYRELTRLLRGYGARNMLVSEHALDGVWSHLAARHADGGWPSAGRTGSAVLIAADLASEIARARPVQRVDLLDPAPGTPRHLMLAPNIYTGLVIGLGTALVSTRPDLVGLGQEVVESADTTVDARFDRFKRAMDGRNGVQALAAEFEAVLPYLP